MPKCTKGSVEFGKVGRRVAEAAFDGGDIVSDGGVLLLRRVDERLGLTRAVAQVFADRRRAASVTHSVRDMIRQRLYALCCGWEDVCDHNVLRADLALQTAVGRAEALASGPTLSRLETSATQEQARPCTGCCSISLSPAARRPPRSWCWTSTPRLRAVPPSRSLTAPLSAVR